LALVLLGLNAYISLKLFGCEYTRSSHSIEGNFIAQSRLREEYPGQRGWWPVLECGHALPELLLSPAAGHCRDGGEADGLVGGTILSYGYRAYCTAWGR